MEIEQSLSNDTNATTVTPLTGNDRYEGYIKVCEKITRIYCL